MILREKYRGIRRWISESGGETEGRTNFVSNKTPHLRKIF